MPILPAEPHCFPEGLLSDSLDVPPDGETVWWVLHTRPRQEKSLARDLCDRGVPFYLPLIRQRSRVRGRVVTAHVPLFTSYVFLLADREQRIAALATRRVVHALTVPDQDKLWRDLRQLGQMIATGAAITPEDRLAPGMAVEIRSGPLAGLKGKILRTASGRRFVVEVDFIQKGASVLLDDYVLTPCERD